MRNKMHKITAITVRIAVDMSIDGTPFGRAKKINTWKIALGLGFGALPSTISVGHGDESSRLTFKIRRIERVKQNSTFTFHL